MRSRMNPTIFKITLSRMEFLRNGIRGHHLGGDLDKDCFYFRCQVMDGVVHISHLFIIFLISLRGILGPCKLGKQKQYKCRYCGHVNGNQLSIWLCLAIACRSQLVFAS